MAGDGSATVQLRVVCKQQAHNLWLGCLPSCLPEDVVGGGNGAWLAGCRLAADAFHCSGIGGLASRTACKRTHALHRPVCVEIACTYGGRGGGGGGVWVGGGG